MCQRGTACKEVTLPFTVFFFSPGESVDLDESREEGGKIFNFLKHKTQVTFSPEKNKSTSLGERVAKTFKHTHVRMRHETGRETGKGTGSLLLPVSQFSA